MIGKIIRFLTIHTKEDVEYVYSLRILELGKQFLTRQSGQ